MISLTLGLALVSVLELLAQAPPVDDVIRVTTKLVQLDAVVTDDRGRLVTDLKCEDFEILQDGKRYPISNCSL